MSTIADRSFERKEKHRQLVIDFVMKYVANPLQDEAIEKMREISLSAALFAVEEIYDQK